jgi:hypothetical protein
MAEVVRCEVIGNLPIVDCESGEDRYKGDIVALLSIPPGVPPGPGECRVDLLVEAGLVKVLGPEAKPAKTTKAL